MIENSLGKLEEMRTPGQHEGVAREHLLSEVVQRPAEQQALNMKDQTSGFADYYQNYLLARVARVAANSDCAEGLLAFIADGAAKGEPLHVQLLADLSKTQLNQSA